MTDEDFFEYTDDQCECCWAHTFLDCNKCKHIECKYNSNHSLRDDEKEEDE